MHCYCDATIIALHIHEKTACEQGLAMHIPYVFGKSVKSRHFSCEYIWHALVFIYIPIFFNIFLFRKCKTQENLCIQWTNEATKLNKQIPLHTLALYILTDQRPNPCLHKLFLSFGADYLFKHSNKASGLAQLPLNPWYMKQQRDQSLISI
jgi:hypothetical protein